MAEINFKESATRIVELVGGKENIDGSKTYFMVIIKAKARAGGAISFLGGLGKGPRFK